MKKVMTERVLCLRHTERKALGGSLLCGRQRKTIPEPKDRTHTYVSKLFRKPALKAD